MNTIFVVIACVAVAAFFIWRRVVTATVVDNRRNFFVVLFATLESLKCYVKHKDPEQALQAFAACQQREADRIGLLQVPDHLPFKVGIHAVVLSTIMHRAIAAADLYLELLRTDTAFGTTAVLGGVFRELNRIVRLNGGVVPPGQFAELYEAYRSFMPTELLERFSEESGV